ncbi:MAG: SRPBCC domain-containing protein, partial [Planctomycetota bacterium]
PPGWSMTVCEMDFRVGGNYESRFRNDQDGTEFGLAGEFLEIESPSKIVQGEVYGLGDADEDTANAAVVTFKFQETSGVTTVVTLIEYASNEARDAALATGMTASMEMGYKIIDELLAKH